MRDDVERRIGWGYGYGAGYVDALRGRPADNVAPPDGRVREGEHEMVNVAEQERTLARDYGVRQRQGQGYAGRAGGGSVVYPDPDEIERLSRAAREMLDASAGIMGAYQVWLQTGDSEAAERLDRFEAAWANLHAIAELSPAGHNLRDTGSHDDA